MTGAVTISVLIPTFNESQNIQQVLESVKSNLPGDKQSEIIVIDDDSPDGTAQIANEFKNKLPTHSSLSVNVIQRKSERGLSSAILTGIKHAKGGYMVVMDSDLSHPPKLIPKMIDEFQNSSNDLVIASRYATGGGVRNWPIKRRIISKGATRLARISLGLKTKDPLSGFFAFKHSILNGIKFDALGYKILLEILVKTRDTRIKEIPFFFTDRKLGTSKLRLSVQIDFIKSVWKLYRYRLKIAKDRKEIQQKVSENFI